MELVESGLTWLMLLVTALGIGAIVRYSLGRIVERFADRSAAPGVAGAVVGLGATWYLIDPVQFGRTSGGTPFLVACLVGVFICVVVVKLLTQLMRSSSAALAVGVAVAVGLCGLLWAWQSPNKLAGIAGIVVVGAYALAVTGSSGLPEAGRKLLPDIGGASAAICLLDWLQAFDRMERILNSSEMDDIATTFWAVTLAVGGSCLLFVAANLVLSQAARQWRWFSAIAGGALGFVLFGLLDGNRLLKIAGPRESVATRLHSLANDGPWRLLIASILIGAVVGFIFDRLAEAITEAGKRRVLGMPVFAVLGAIWGLLFAGRIPVDTTVRVLWTALIGAAIGAIFGYVISGIEDLRIRMIASAVGGAGIGLIIGALLKTVYQPRLETVPLVVAPIAVAALGAGLAKLRGRDPLGGGLTGAMVGWLLGTFGFPTLGSGPEVETLLAAGVGGALGGLRFGAKPYLDIVGRDRFEQKSRTVVFLGPALTFIGAGLIIPLLRTMYLSFNDERIQNWVGLENYRTVFTDPRSFDYSGRLDLFGSQLFKIGLALMASAVVVGFVRGARTKSSTEWGSGLRYAIGPLLILAGLFEYVLGRQTDGASGGPLWISLILAVAGLAILFVPTSAMSGSSLNIDLGGAGSAAFGAGIFFLAFAMFTALRGTIINNLWWVFTVTLAATGLGMAVAVLADKAKHENVAKSFIFMPLAISFVGAGIIWRFVYIARPPTKLQTGLLNFMWVRLGEFSTTPSTGRTVSLIILTLLLAALAYLFIEGYIAKASGVMGSSALLGALTAFFLYRFTIGTGIGGIEGVDADGESTRSTILFLTDSQPFNNLWLMIVLIWIQTGFAMVIFSAAIKAVPQEFLEASRVDGATESQIFWKITLPTITPTIGVVVTTLIVSVMKVFDIVKVMTNGNFDTQVVANEMWQRAFTELNFGLGSALAIVLFLSVVPVMYYNIRNMQEAG